MAEALVRGFINKGIVKSTACCCTDPVAARKELFQSIGVRAYDGNLQVRRPPWPHLITPSS